MDVVLWVVAVLLVGVGVVGIVVPALPGTILIFAGLLAAAWADDFMRVGPLMLVVIAIVGVATYGVDFVATALGARHLGASKRGNGRGGARHGPRILSRPTRHHHRAVSRCDRRRADGASRLEACRQ